MEQTYSYRETQEQNKDTGTSPYCSLYPVRDLLSKHLRQIPLQELEDIIRHNVQVYDLDTERDTRGNTRILKTQVFSLASRLEDYLLKFKKLDEIDLPKTVFIRNLGLHILREQGKGFYTKTIRTIFHTSEHYHKVRVHRDDAKELVERATALPPDNPKKRD